MIILFCFLSAASSATPALLTPNYAIPSDQWPDVLCCGEQGETIAQEFDCSPQMVRLRLHRFDIEGIEGWEIDQEWDIVAT